MSEPWLKGTPSVFPPLLLSLTITTITQSGPPDGEHYSLPVLLSQWMGSRILLLVLYSTTGTYMKSKILTWSLSFISFDFEVYKSTKYVRVSVSLRNQYQSSLQEKLWAQNAWFAWSPIILICYFSPQVWEGDKILWVLETGRHGVQFKILHFLCNLSSLINFFTNSFPYLRNKVFAVIESML